jgi:hypothetical protein
MPRRAPTPCGNTGCPNVRPCAIHPASWSEGQHGRTMPPGWSATVARIMRRDAHRCRWCGAPATEVHHLVPGAEVDELLVALCSDCHAPETQRQAAAGRNASAPSSAAPTYDALLGAQRNATRPEPSRADDQPSAPRSAAAPSTARRPKDCSGAAGTRTASGRPEHAFGLKPEGLFGWGGEPLPRFAGETSGARSRAPARGFRPFRSRASPALIRGDAPGGARAPGRGCSAVLPGPNERSGWPLAPRSGLCSGARDAIGPNSPSGGWP